MFEVGKTYETKKHGKFECIVVTETHAWLKATDHDTAYVWTQNGKSLSLGQDWDIKPKPREYWMYRNFHDLWYVVEWKPKGTWDEVIHVHEVLDEC